YSLLLVRRRVFQFKKSFFGIGLVEKQGNKLSHKVT
ncbi:hypothetical protein CP061683_0553B, partial [Chlamydia psittaci 06-1683]